MEPAQEPVQDTERAVDASHSSVSDEPKAAPAKRSVLCMALTAAAILIVILAIVIPLAVILPKKHSSNSGSGSSGGSGSGGSGSNGTGGAKPPTISSQILLSLYIYPKPIDLWQPLFDSLAANPNTTFVCIVNPNSGPGDTQYPDQYYEPAVRKLNSYPNAKSIGYVRTGYGTRPIDTIIGEVNQYAGWANKSMDLAMKGIFFDESPHQYVAASVPLIETINLAVKNNTSGLQGKMTVHNPGVIPDPRYNNTNTDVTVIFEETYTIFQQRAATIKQQPKTRSRYAFFINSVPYGTNVSTLTDELSQIAEYLYITDEQVNFYESFGKIWTNFTADVPNPTKQIVYDSDFSKLNF